MIYPWLADAVLVIHLAFVLFVIGGGFCALRWPKLAWGHVPAALWGALIELRNGVCPLTPLENWLRRQGDEAQIEGSFVEDYLLPVIYPEGLTREVQIALGLAVILLNLVAYGLLVFQRRSRK